MIIVRQKTFSIQSGGPDQGGSLSRELKSRIARGGIIGGAGGGILGLYPSILVGTENGASTGLKVWGGITAASAIIGAVVDAFGAMGAGGRSRVAKESSMNEFLDYLYNMTATSERDRDYRRGTTEINIQRYVLEDQDPSKYMVNFSFEDGKMVIYLNKPTDKLIANVNDDLESMVRFNRKADYAAKKVGDGFLIFIVLPSIDEAAGIIYNIVEENKIKVNALTEKSLAKIKK
jgi:hypothetical protein